MSPSEHKLTKKQKKTAAFRDRKKKKTSTKANGDDELENDLPIAEDQDLAEALAEAEETTVVTAKSLTGKSKEKAASLPQPKEESTKSKPTKKRKRSDEETEEALPANEAGAEADDAESKSVERKRRKKTGNNEADEGKRRLILFLGNLKFTTSTDAIATHFASCDPPPQIRLLTPKPKPGAQASTTKSKGCAFLEFSTQSSLQQALRLHHSALDGRQINVELTAGGGGKSESRVAKLKERNKELHTQRTKQAEKRKSKKSTETPEEELAKLTAGKRYSATSGVDQAPTTKRTWTIGDTVEDTTHRGGVKHKKERKRGARVKSQASGMNAIPIG